MPFKFLIQKVTLSTFSTTVNNAEMKVISKTKLPFQHRKTFKKGFLLTIFFCINNSFLTIL